MATETFIFDPSTNPLPAGPGFLSALDSPLGQADALDLRSIDDDEDEDEDDDLELANEPENF